MSTTQSTKFMITNHCYADDHHEGEEMINVLLPPPVGPGTPRSIWETRTSVAMVTTASEKRRRPIYKTRTLCDLITVDVCICDNTAPTVLGGWGGGLIGM